MRPASPPQAPFRGRARSPDQTGRLERDGVGISWESYGYGDPVMLFLPTWSIIHSRCWKQQVPDFARRHRVLTFDPRGNGNSDRPTAPEAYTEDAFARDGAAVLDATGTGAAIVVGLSIGAQRALILAAEHPDRVCALILVGPSLGLGLPLGSERDASTRFDVDLGVDDGWARYNAHSWRRDYRGFLEFFFDEVFNESHSTRQIEDCVDWGLETDAETLITAEVPYLEDATARALCARVRCPVLVVHGDDDRVAPFAMGAEVARLTGGRLVTFTGSGHCPHARDPVRFNLTLRHFIDSLAPASLRGSA